MKEDALDPMTLRTFRWITNRPTAAEREAKRATAQKRIEQLIHEYEIDESAGIDTRWSEMVEIMEAKKHSVPVYAEAEPIDKLTAFEEYVKDLEREDFQAKKQERRRRERKCGGGEA